MNPKSSLALMLLVVVVTGLAAWLRYAPGEDARSRLDALPVSGPGFSSRDLPLSAYEKQMLSGANALKRIYSWRGNALVLMAIDGTRNRHAVHDPRYCFRGAGWRITADKEIRLPGGEGRLLEMEREGQKNEAIVFYSSDDRLFASSIEYWLQATVRRWLRRDVSAEPVLVILQPVGREQGDPQAYFSLLGLLPKI